jgi:SP family general alpha glucoside:H+ symporter-like MFS transporter
MQWIFPVPLGIIACFAPESPWWLVRKGRFADAEKSVRGNAKAGFYGPNEVEGFVAYMRHTDALEKIEAKHGSWAELFKGNNRRRTEIVSVEIN